MSDNWLIIIPDSPGYLPPIDAQNQAIAFFKSIAPKAHEIEVHVSEHPRLIDCGANFEKVICPKCRKKLNIDWWTDWVSQEAKLNFPLKSAPLPCCGTLQSLNDLIYDWPLGFARFSLGAMNPNIKDLPPDDQSKFETILGCRLLKIWRHI